MLRWLQPPAPGEAGVSDDLGDRAVTRRDRGGGLGDKGTQAPLG